jgi:hypothetical protein
VNATAEGVAVVNLRVNRMQPSCAVSHPVGAAHRALCGAQQPDCVRCSQRKIH